MAAYCAKSDLLERFGQVELAQLTDETAAASPDDSEVTKACDEATSLVDAYLSASYVVPLAAPIPTIIRKFACDIARKYLWKDRAKPDSVVTKNYEDAVNHLTRFAKGTVGLPDAVGVAPVGSGFAVKVLASPRVFTDELLAYM